ncbi:MAG: hypothetical protein ACFCUO_11865 [Rhodospirillales bacterium]
MAVKTLIENETREQRTVGIVIHRHLSSVISRKSLIPLNCNFWYKSSKVVMMFYISLIQNDIFADAASHFGVWGYSQSLLLQDVGENGHNLRAKPRSPVMRPHGPGRRPGRGSA